MKKLIVSLIVLALVGSALAAGENLFFKPYTGSEPDTLLLYHFDGATDTAREAESGSGSNYAITSWGVHTSGTTDSTSATGGKFDGAYVSTVEGYGIAADAISVWDNNASNVHTVEGWFWIDPSVLNPDGTWNLANMGDATWEMELLYIGAPSGHGIWLGTEFAVDINRIVDGMGYGLGGSVYSDVLEWQPETWYHLAFEYRNSDHPNPGETIYRDGVVIGTDDRSVTWASDNDTDLKFANWNGTYEIGWVGMLDEIRISNTEFNPITAPQIATITESDGSTLVREQGETSDSFTVVLDLKDGNDDPIIPSANVAIVVDPNLDGDGPSEDLVLVGADPDGTVTLTFTPADWDTPQTVTVTAIDDSVEEGTESLLLELTSSSSDPNFDGLNTYVPNLAVTVLDNDVPEVRIDTGDGVAVTEGLGDTDTYTVELMKAPTLDVAVQMAFIPALPPLNDAVALWNMKNEDDYNGPPYSNLGGIGGVDVSGEPITAANFNGWAHQGNTYTFFGTDPTELTQAGVMSIFARVKYTAIDMGGEDGITDIIGAMDGNCEFYGNPADVDNYSLRLDNGVPSLQIWGVDPCGVMDPARTIVSSTATLAVDTWYDITGVFDPANDSASIYVYNPVNGSLIDSQSISVAFDAIKTAENNSGGMEFHLFMDACNNDGTLGHATALMESAAVWDRALTTQEVADISDANLVGGIGGLTQVTVNGKSNETLIFTSSDWNTPQTVTVSAVDDDVLEYDHVTEIPHIVVTSDPDYSGLPADSAMVAIADNECGAWDFQSMDFNEDCFVGLEDFALFALDWLTCTKPNTPGCYQP